MIPDYHETWSSWSLVIIKAGVSTMNNKTEGSYVYLNYKRQKFYIAASSIIIFSSILFFSLFISSFYPVRLRREIISRRALFVASELSVLAPPPWDLCVAMEMMETSTQYHGRLGGSLCSINDHHMALGQLSKGNSSEDTSSGKWTMLTSFTSSRQAFPLLHLQRIFYANISWAAKGDNRSVCRIREISSSLLAQEEYSRSLQNLSCVVLTVI